MRIPARFKVFGHTYRVEIVQKVDDMDSWGATQFMDKTIVLKRAPRRSDIEETFLHEMLHCLFHEMSEAKLRDEENLVQRMAQTLHQALTTGEGEVR